MPPSSPRALPTVERSFPVRTPHRLDLTVAVLRRLSTNLVDRLTDDGRYVRALRIPAGEAVVEAWAPCPDLVTVRLHEARGDCDALAERVARMLGLERTTEVFAAGARGLPWLAPLAERMRGVRPPRYPTLWEAVVNAVVFQQISIYAAAAILGRLVARHGTPHRFGGHELVAFPEPERFVESAPEPLRELGLSTGKIETLKRVAAAIAGGLDGEALESASTRDLTERLQAIKGIGPWTAAVIALRGFGRLNVFPVGDSGIRRGMRDVAGEEVALDAVLAALGEERAMLYYHLLLARLELRGEI